MGGSARSAARAGASPAAVACSAALSARPAAASCWSAFASFSFFFSRRRSRHTPSAAPKKSEGSSSIPSADMTPSAPVSFRLAVTSAAARTLPLARIGTPRSASLIAATCSSIAGPSRRRVALPR